MTKTHKELLKEADLWRRSNAHHGGFMPPTNSNAAEDAIETYRQEIHRLQAELNNKAQIIICERDRLASLEKIAGELEETSRCPIGCSSHRGTLDLCNCDRGIARAALAAWIKDGESCPA